MGDAGLPSARELMIDVFAYPHIPYWFTVRQAVGILKNSLLKEDGIQPAVVLVFDERYNLVGFLGLQDLLLGMAPLYGEGEPAAEWAARPVSGLMTAVKTFVDPGAGCAEAARALAASGLPLLPVLENRKKLVGLVRARELFREFAGRI
jgi:CBS-domain-containing membrane protein